MLLGQYIMIIQQLFLATRSGQVLEGVSARSFGVGKRGMCFRGTHLAVTSHAYTEILESLVCLKFRPVGFGEARRPSIT